MPIFWESCTAYDVNEPTGGYTIKVRGRDAGNSTNQMMMIISDDYYDANKLTNYEFPRVFIWK